MTHLLGLRLGGEGVHHIYLSVSIDSGQLYHREYNGCAIDLSLRLNCSITCVDRNLWNCKKEVEIGGSWIFHTQNRGREAVIFYNSLLIRNTILSFKVYVGQYSKSNATRTMAVDSLNVPTIISSEWIVLLPLGRAFIQLEMNLKQKQILHNENYQETFKSIGFDSFVILSIRFNIFRRYSSAFSLFTRS